MSPWKTIAACAALSVSCGGGSSAPAGPAGAPPPCPTVMTGPFARVLESPRASPAVGGFLPDGTYDLIVLGVDKVDPRPGRMAEAVRWEMTLTTDQRDAQHQEGRAFMVVGSPPQVECAAGRFAVVGNQLRFAAPMRGLGAVNFSATPDGFVIDTPSGGGLDVKSLVFRRR